MKTILCNIEYIFSKQINSVRKRNYIDEFMTRRAMAVELLNPNYERWNEEFRGDFESQEYTDFIADKQDKILDIVNSLKVHAGKQHIILMSSREECGDIVAYNKEHDITIKLVLNNMKELI